LIVSLSCTGLKAMRSKGRLVELENQQEEEILTMKKLHYHISYLAFIFFLTFLSRCNGKDAVQLLSYKEIKYSTFSWYREKASNSFEPYINFYLQINNTGDYLLMKHTVFNDAPKYLQGTIDDTIANMIAVAFPDTLYGQLNYFYNDSAELYNGFTHCIDYTNEQTDKRTVIQFVPSEAPANIQQIAEMLNRLIQSSTQKSTNPFELKNYEKELIRINKSTQFPIIGSPKMKYKN